VEVEPKLSEKTRILAYFLSLHERMDQNYPYMKLSPIHNFYHVVPLTLFNYLKIS